jgi:flagellar biosynthesis/type III secretory pathway ATPase
MRDAAADQDVETLLSRWQHALDHTPPCLPRSGRIAGACGTLIKVSGLQLHIGQTCWLRSPRSAQDMPAEVVGLDGGHALLMPAGGMQGIGTDTTVQATTGLSAPSCSDGSSTATARRSTSSPRPRAAFACPCAAPRPNR